MAEEALSLWALRAACTAAFISSLRHRGRGRITHRKTTNERHERPRTNTTGNVGKRVPGAAQARLLYALRKSTPLHRDPHR